MHFEPHRTIIQLVMRTALRKLRQITIGLMAILSLSVASVAACACSHHQSEAAPQLSCHSNSGHHEQKKATPTGHHHISQSCECIPAATKLSVKAEGFKFKKHATVSSVSAASDVPGFYSTGPAKSAAIGRLFYTGSFYNSTTARGPPLT